MPAFLRRVLWTLAALLVPAPAVAELEIVDVAGRSVTLERPAQRILLGEGRFLIALSLLAPRDPIARVAGMLNEFRRYDPAGFARYRAAFPEIDAVPLIGQTTEDSVSLEALLMQAPDAAVFGLSGHGPNARSAVLIRRLEEAGIPVLFIDFRDDPIGNTARSMRILGSVLGIEAEAESFAAFHEAELARVTERLQGLDGPRPSVLIEARVGLGEGCCFSIARGMFADMIDVAGGVNLASGRLPGPVGTLSLEFVIASDPEIYLGTAIGALDGPMQGPGRIVLGPGVTPDAARESLAAAVDRAGLRTLQAVRSGRAYALWHHFYNSPLNVYAVQQLASWLHPTRFADLDPEATLGNLLNRLQPVDLSGTYGIALDGRSAR